MFQNKDTKEAKLKNSLQKRKNMFLVSEDQAAEHMQMHAELKGAAVKMKPPNSPGNPLDVMSRKALLFAEKETYGLSSFSPK